MPPFTNNQSKNIIRERWNTPLLRHLHQTYNIQFKYLGLPGVELIDVKLWKDMLSEIVAFEPPDEGVNNWESISELRKNLKKLPIPHKTYCGSIEEVVLRKRDFEGKPYSQTNVITLYNLDFCDEIGSSVNTISQGTKTLRFEAIRQVLTDQKECSRKLGGPAHFILLLTIRNQIDAFRDKSLLTKLQIAEAKEFRGRCNTLMPLPSRGPLRHNCAWALKAFLYNQLCMNFNNPNFSALFFPMALYDGTPIAKPTGQIPSPMIHWMILCKIENEEVHNPVAMPEGRVLQTSSVGIRMGRLNWFPQTGETNTDIREPNSVTWLTENGGEMLTGLGTSLAKRV